MAFAGDFTPVLAKHSKSFSLIDCISVGVDRMQRNFEPMRKQVEEWQKYEPRDRTSVDRVSAPSQPVGQTVSQPLAYLSQSINCIVGHLSGGGILAEPHLRNDLSGLLCGLHVDT